MTKRPTTRVNARAGARDQTLPADARAVRDALSALIRVAQYRDRGCICCHDISVSQCHALEEVLNRGPITLGDLATTLYLDKSTASRVVGGLIDKGYVSRTTHPDDARAIQLEATSKGRKELATIERELLAETRALIADVEPAVRHGMVRLLAQLARAIATRAGVPCGCCESNS
jgi:MarR family 2-MHQ and catechol resistance regulon transcriptional repressor